MSAPVSFFAPVGNTIAGGPEFFRISIELVSLADFEIARLLRDDRCRVHPLRLQVEQWCAVEALHGDIRRVLPARPTSATVGLPMELGRTRERR
jgi:hypothetical protein